MPPAGPPTSSAFRPARSSLPASATMSRSGVPTGTSATPAPPGARTETRIVAGLAFERLQEDGFLAQHVRALDRADRDLDGHARAEDVVAGEPRLDHPGK